jgi:hypothetical protein
MKFREVEVGNISLERSYILCMIHLCDWNYSTSEINKRNGKEHYKEHPKKEE